MPSADTAVREAVGWLVTSLSKGTTADEVTLGQRPEYSNVGYELLGALITHLTGEPYADFLERKILPRYGMTHSTIQRPGTPPPEDFHDLATELVAAATSA